VYVECRINKNALLQAAFFGILPTGLLESDDVHCNSENKRNTDIRVIGRKYFSLYSHKKTCSKEIDKELDRNFVIGAEWKG